MGRRSTPGGGRKFRERAAERSGARASEKNFRTRAKQNIKTKSRVDAVILRLCISCV